MLKLKFECSILAQDEDNGFWLHRVINSRNTYDFTLSLANHLFMVNQYYEQHSRATEQDEMEKQSELPF